MSNTAATATPSTRMCALGQSSVAPSLRRAASVTALRARTSTRTRRSALVVASTSERLNVVLVGAECAPFSKTGGLGDVMASLPKVHRT